MSKMKFENVTPGTIVAMENGQHVLKTTSESLENAIDVSTKEIVAVPGHSTVIVQSPRLTASQRATIEGLSEKLQYLALEVNSIQNTIEGLQMPFDYADLMFAKDKLWEVSERWKNV